MQFRKYILSHPKIVGFTLSYLLLLLLPFGLMAEERTMPRDTSFTAWSTYIKTRKHHPEIKLAPDSMPHGVKAWRDEVYTTLEDTPFGRRELHADVFRPDNDSILPALIMIHGGGWNSGDKSLQRPMAMKIAEAGFVTIPVEYRLIPEALFPAGLHDIKTAVRWIRANAGRYGVDPQNIAVSGCSAGAQLSTLVGVTNSSPVHEGEGQWSDTSSDVQAVVNIDGVATFITPTNIADGINRLKTRGEKPVNARWLGGMFYEANKNWIEASAINWVTPKSAPICFISSELPRYSEGRDELYGIYEAMGIHAERHRVGSPLHPFWLFEPWFTPTVGIITDYLNRTFKANQ